MNKIVLTLNMFDYKQKILIIKDGKEEYKETTLSNIAQDLYQIAKDVGVDEIYYGGNVAESFSNVGIANVVAETAYKYDKKLKFIKI